MFEDRRSSDVGGETDGTNGWATGVRVGFSFAAKTRGVVGETDATNERATAGAMLTEPEVPTRDEDDEA